jgi:hypothetical protein
MGTSATNSRRLIVADGGDAAGCMGHRQIETSCVPAARIATFLFESTLFKHLAHSTRVGVHRAVLLQKCVCSMHCWHR